MSKKSEKIQWKNQLINLLAIVIGVYIAFYLTERSNNANSRRQAKAYLASMADDLQSDIDELTISTDTLRYMVKVSDALTQSIVTQRIIQDSIGTMISSLYLIVPFNPKDNSYQSLVASGKLDAIENFELRKKITELYHQHYGSIKIFDDISNQQRISIITPYLMRTMQFSTVGLQNASQLWKDNMFANLAFSMHFNNTMKHRMDSTALVQAKELRKLLLAELNP
ncbi:hypothetical protein SanaruYs_33370 [Chryseotalea sanaruensis]|uniref:Uncharacterized protein n=1 Tax=Chryseotalea sanaruensis TaxID=2482724 RepID=A0A401UDW6_9BACT|nr:DUF6090 family protein [Chryseotalea sanaruensis]GCC53095.1 hypothetical protein SanaruYs_33370 [Chryseotalea sanaruensis]